MEQLAMLVLNGEGKKLIGKSTTQPDIQAFIDNVPAYMVSWRDLVELNISCKGVPWIIQTKIRRVHVAAREGGIRELQTALDRRKFSTAKDEISPKGKTLINQRHTVKITNLCFHLATTPMHVAVIFGHAGKRQISFFFGAKWGA